VCLEIEAEYRRETGKLIHLNHNTLHSLVKGGHLRADVNAKKSWLTPDEKEEVISYALECASWGHLLNHQRLKEHVDELCHVRLGSKFPESGIGKNWTYCFVARHADCL
ncbi:hypothetical protein K435DRAFT_603135, partial [Dendrothele bispora CBS 962.96]